MLHTRIAEFLTTLPNMATVESRQALLYQAGFDEELQRQIDVTGPPGQFFQSLVAILNRYGTLHDGRHAVEALLNAAKRSVGKEGQAQCEQLLGELHGVLAEKSTVHVQRDITPVPLTRSSAKPPAPAESLDTQILRVLAVYYQQHPGDTDGMLIDDVLNALPQHPPQTLQAQLFALKKKGWIGYELTPEGDSGFVWIEPKGLKIAKVNR